MSGEEADKMLCCASCGTAGVDDIKLKKCTACHLVKYCSVKCQREHRPQHKKKCKKRAAELRDELLFKQPEGRHHGDCPICCHPLPLDPKLSMFMGCCCNMICLGCEYANQEREFGLKLEEKCPFCRQPSPKSEEEHLQRVRKRIEANDPVAFWEMGKSCEEEGDYRGAFQNFSKGAELGNLEAHHELSLLYQKGEGVGKDLKKQFYHLEEAAIGGHPDARHNLGCHELESNPDRAVKHFIIAANLGLDESLGMLKDLFRLGLVSNEDLAAALRAHQASVDETKSRQRDAAEAALAWREAKDASR
mmetsp:Transcript_16921/g.27800  ORF Transcript_16921/g.27800 Transcript_16921/m.27800 type:complete len:305 (-) Transcript_16921:242-1156(-)